METSKAMESLGVLHKEEKLQTVEHYVLENTLVLENTEPFPGYHGTNLPVNKSPDSLFFITDKQYSTERIFRISQHICCYQHIKVNACPVEITLQDITYFGIRIRGLTNYSLIADLQGCYNDREIKFAKVRDIHALGLIRVTKIFSIEKLDHFIFKDIDAEDTCYISVPYHFDWNLFRKVTKSVKNNVDNSNFDCASGFIYFKEMMEFVRVYGTKADVPRLQVIRQKYLEEIAKIRDDSL
jgi:hypothetical protein